MANLKKFVKRVSIDAIVFSDREGVEIELNEKELQYWRVIEENFKTTQEQLRRKINVARRKASQDSHRNSDP